MGTRKCKSGEEERTLAACHRLAASLELLFQGIPEIRDLIAETRDLIGQVNEAGESRLSSLRGMLDRGEI